MNDNPQAPLVQNQVPTIYPQVMQHPVVPMVSKTPCKCKVKMRAYLRNHRKVLKVFAVIGFMITTPIITVLRIVSSVVGLRCLRKNSPVLLIVFGGMCVYNIGLTVCSPFLITIFQNGVFHRNNNISIWLLCLSFIHSVFMLIPQTICLVKTIKYYREERDKHSGPDQSVSEVQEIQLDIPVVDLQQVHKQQQVVPNQNMVVSFPPPPSNEIVREQIQTPVVDVQQVDYSKQLKFLREMGFSDETKNVQLLNQYKGNVQTVVQNYITQ